MSEELKPCSVCGSSDVRAFDAECGGLGPRNQVKCDNCQHEMSLKRWNTRPIEDALHAELTEQKMMYEIIEQKLNDTCDSVVWYKTELATRDKLIKQLNVHWWRFMKDMTKSVR